MAVSVVRLNVTPVKGFSLAHPSEVALTPIGVPENRRFYLIDAQGAMVSADRFGPLQRIRAETDPGGLSLTFTFPDGSVVAGDAAPTDEAVTTDFYGRPVTSHHVNGPFAQALSDYVGFEVHLVRTDEPGEGSDVHRLTLVSRASVAELGRAGGAEGELDARRFRMLFELDGCAAYEEDTWDGRLLQVGGAAIRVCGQVPRCVITTQSPQSGLKDFETLKVLATSRGRMADLAGLPFGMYGEVERTGTVRVGDTVTLLRSEG
ncbi:MAG: MOSC N-terminal beta barrel domain-containing protein [Actinomycetota bacterium]